VEYADAAVALGFHSLGFSEHGYVPFGGLYAGMAPGSETGYREAVGDAKRAYAGRLCIFLGLENDSVNMRPIEDFDYTIGSVHCINRNGKYYSVDSREYKVADAIASEFGGDGLAYAEAYFEAVRVFASEKRADVMGHIDLVRRFNANGKYFDENCAAYRRAAAAALEAAVASGYIIEVSTAPLQKGFSCEPYPARFLLELAWGLGARVAVNSDAHSAEGLAYAFDKIERLLADIGFKERWELTKGSFSPVGM